MKGYAKYLLTIVFTCASLFALCQKQEAINIYSDSEYQANLLQSKYNLRFYPIALAAGQLGDYCMEWRLVFEKRIAKRNSISFGIAADIPGPGEAVPALVGVIDGTPAPAYFGGRATFEFRHYYVPRRHDVATNPPSKSRVTMPFIGGGISLNSMNGLLRNDYSNDGSSLYPQFESPPNRAHLIMSNYYFSAGCETMKRRHRWDKNDLLIDIGGTIGYRFDYFWRHYPGLGNLEFEKTGLYWWYKTVPICATINLSIGGVF
jgi:hypothetical protein